MKRCVISMTMLLVCVNAHPAWAVALMNATTNNGSFNNPLPAAYTAWPSATYQTGWTASPFDVNDGNRQWSDAASTPNVAPSGNPTVSGPGVIGGYPNGSAFTSDPIGVVTNLTTYTLSGYSGYSYGNTNILRRIELIATDGVIETPLIALDWAADNGAFTQKIGTPYLTLLADPLAGQNLFVRASLYSGASFASFADIVVDATVIPEPSTAVLAVFSVGLPLVVARRARTLIHRVAKPI